MVQCLLCYHQYQVSQGLPPLQLGLDYPGEMTRLACESLQIKIQEVLPESMMVILTSGPFGPGNPGIPGRPGSPW